MNALEMISNSSMKTEAPKFEIGDTVRVHVKIKEGDKSRIQVFEGTVIAKKHGGISETFTVRRVAHGCGIERVFPLHSPVVDKVEVVRHGKVRRAKLYYLRDRVGKAAKVKKNLLSKIRRSPADNPAGRHCAFLRDVKVPFLLLGNIECECI